MARAKVDSLEELFKAFPALLGRAATAGERSAFERYADLLILWNRTHHLTALRSRAAIGRGLFLDSLLFRALIPRGPIRVADIGAGAGIPGVPLRIVDREISLTLIDSRRKPVSYLHALTRELGMADVMVHHGRAERLIMELPELLGKYDCVLARSVSLEPDFIETAMLYVKPGGRVLMAGPPNGGPELRLNTPGRAEWKAIQFQKIGMTRSFLIVTKEG